MPVSEGFSIFLILAGAGINLVLTPLAIQLSHRFNLIDRPGHRKIHQVPIPKVGGLAAFASILICLLVGLLFAGPDGSLSTPGSRKLLFILIFSLGGFLLGLLDDLFDLRPRHKFLAQFFLAGAFAVFGYRFEVVHVPGVHIFHLYWVSIPVTIFWMMAVVNGLNFADILDGLAGMVCLCGFVSFGLASWLIHGEITGHLWLCVVGALLTFLFFNWKPAKVYLGDGGATGFGFLLACCLVGLGNDAGPARFTFSTPQSKSEPFWFQFFVVSLFAGYPLMEAALSTLRRGVKRFVMNRSMEFSEQEHIGHRLLRLGVPAGRICRLVGLFQLLLTLAGLFLMSHDNAFAVLTVLPLFMGLSFFMPRLGFFEFLDLKFIRANQPHYQIAHHFIMVQKVKLGLAQTRQEVLALVSQTCREFGVRCVRFKIRPNQQDRGGLQYTFQQEIAKDNLAGGDEEFYDYFEGALPRCEAFWIFTAHTGTEELDVEYRVLMNLFIEKAMAICVRLGEGQENLVVGGLVDLPHAKISGHHLRRRRGRGWS